MAEIKAHCIPEKSNFRDTNSGTANVLGYDFMED